MKKILFFSMTCGEGHNTIAKSLMQEFQFQGHETKLCQVYGFDEKRIKKENKLFLFAVKHFPHIYNHFWNKLRNKNKKTEKLPFFVKQCLPYFQQEIEAFKPDIIVCTHNYASMVLSYMKKNNLLDKKIIISTILFDFVLCPYWEYSKDVDYIFQPHTNTTDHLLQKGFTQNQIKTFGLPIRKEFSIPFNTKEIKKQLKLKDIPTVLTTAGGYGLGNTLKLLKNILKYNKDIQVIVVNGKNQKNYNIVEKYIKKNNIKNVINLGFVTNFADYMKASDLIIGRAGSGTLSESFALNKPLIIREKLILNEKLGKEMFIKEGCALGLKKISEAGKKVYTVLNNKSLYETMVNNTKKYSKPSSSENIVNFLLEKEKREI